MEDLKQLAKSIEEKLDQIDGWKMVHGNGLFGGKRKNSLANYRASSQKGVVPLYALRRDEFDNNHYAIYAFSTTGELSSDQLAQLKAETLHIPLNLIRYDSKLNTFLEGMRCFYQNLDENDGKHNQISIALTDEANGLFVFVQSRSNKSKLDAPLVIYGINGRQVYVYPVADYKLKKISGS